MHQPIDYQTVEDANMRLAQTVIRYEGEPIFVNGIEPEEDDEGRPLDNYVFFQYLDTGNRTKKDWRDPGFDKSNVPLGYVNFEKSVTADYAVRVPHRQYKQGLDGRSMRFIVEEGFRFNTLFPYLYKTIKGIYPEFKEAEKTLSELEPGVSGEVAFCRKLALSKNHLGLYLIHYRGEEVAYKEGDKFVLGPAYYYLKEVLQHLGVNVYANSD